MALRIELHEDAGAVAAQWDDLADRTGADPFMRPGWHAAWHDAFGSGRPVALAAWRGGELAALAPLVRGRLRLASPTNWHTPTYAPLADSPEALERLSHALVRRARPWLSIAFVDEGTPELDALQDAARAASCPMRAYELEQSPYIEIAGGWEAYEKRLGAKRRANLRRLRRRLEERGDLAFTHHDGTERLDELLEQGLVVEASGWKGEGRTAVRSDPATHRFYAEIARWASDRGWLRLAFLRLDDQALAFDFAIEAAGAHSLLKTGYDERWRSSAPGLLLRHEMVRRAFASELDTYEFLGDAVDWKREWTETTRRRMALEVFGAAPAGRATWLGWRYARPAAKRLWAMR